jgi:hypothetical protein
MAKAVYTWGQIGTVLNERDVIVDIDQYHDEAGWHRDGPYPHLAKETLLVAPPRGGYGSPVETPHYSVKRLATTAETLELEHLTGTAYSYGD